MSDRHWDCNEGRWIYDAAECTCDLMAHPCDVHDTEGRPAPVASIAQAFRDAALHHRWRNPEHRHVRMWLIEYADQIEEEAQ